MDVKPIHVKTLRKKIPNNCGRNRIEYESRTETLRISRELHVDWRTYKPAIKTNTHTGSKLLRNVHVSGTKPCKLKLFSNSVWIGGHYSIIVRSTFFSLIDAKAWQPF